MFKFKFLNFIFPTCAFCDIVSKLTNCWIRIHFIFIKSIIANWLDLFLMKKSVHMIMQPNKKHWNYTVVNHVCLCMQSINIWKNKIWLYAHRRRHFLHFGNKHSTVHRECMITGSDYFYSFSPMGLSFPNKFVSDMPETHKIFNQEINMKSAASMGNLHAEKNRVL